MKLGRQSSHFFILNLTSIIHLISIVIMSLLLVFILIGTLTSLKPGYRVSSSAVNEAAKHFSSKTLYKYLLSDSQLLVHNFPVQDERPVSNLVFEMLTNIRFEDPRSFLGRELPGFEIFDSKILVAGDGANYTNVPIESVPPDSALKAKDPATQNTDQIDDKSSSDEAKQPPERTTGGKKRVFIYFTHTHESYLPYLKGVTNPNLAQHSKINVTKVGEKLAQDLEDRGIGATSSTTDIQKLLVQNHMDYTQSYQESRTVVEAAMKNDRDLQYFIDVHRDSRRRKDTTVEINGKSYAKIAFIIGGENPNWEKNAKLAEDLHNLIKKKYKNLSRGVILKKGALTNGKFNQDLSGNSFLIEVGGVDNTFEEMYRTMDVFADVFAQYYWQAQSVSGSGSAETGKN
ncbi:stage II sporulation protein P [Weizmannia acidilactici]|uniref:Stage II sporulation protein P n=1 Tax=Weizmannia acidilactici TaxID=2607726 RepID=A0A5J4JE23_9BACI|nr:stage II sporulation protein P [Weizmannia acidilactici]GER66955.1 stage II sporulation protein P [Weizmannia acidilactici]GER69609.1 stage II sporulation protein P [Weizmannia acidilactici]GER72714.1 stage II sporulation protein P [Weizmannia acidilactici]